MIHSYEKINRSIFNQMETFRKSEEWLPGIKIIQQIAPERNLYLCNRGKERFQLSEESFKHLSKDEFRTKIFNERDPQTCLIGTSEEAFIKQDLHIRYNPIQSIQEAELVSVQLIEEKALEFPMLKITTILPFSLLGWVPAKTARIVDEMCFQNNHRKKYQQLTKRNREVLALMVKGISAEEIGERLFIGVNTVNTHKRRVREILEIKSNYELLQYGLAFDLV